MCFPFNVFGHTFSNHHFTPVAFWSTSSDTDFMIIIFRDMYSDHQIWTHVYRTSSVGTCFLFHQVRTHVFRWASMGTCSLIIKRGYLISDHHLWIHVFWSSSWVTCFLTIEFWHKISDHWTSVLRSSYLETCFWLSCLDTYFRFINFAHAFSDHHVCTLVFGSSIFNLCFQIIMFQHIFLII